MMMYNSASSSSLPLCGSSSRNLHGSLVHVPRKWLYLAAFFLLLPWGVYNRTASQFKSLSNELEMLQNLQHRVADRTNTKHQLMKALQSIKTELESSNEALVQHVRKSGTLVDIHTDAYDKLERREEAMIKCIDSLESHVRENSRLAVEKEYGTGPYQVELTLRTKVHMRVKRKTLVFELAPLNLMPHSVHHFLRMLSKRLWEGMVFMPQQHLPHRIQASPVDMETLEDMDWRFENAKLKNLIFSEHSSQYNCGSYSLGFSGSPGGPDFYINGLDLPEKLANDSCFGKVVQGNEIIDSIIQKKESPILGIETMRLLPRE